MANRLKQWWQDRRERKRTEQYWRDVWRHAQRSTLVDMNEMPELPSDPALMVKNLEIIAADVRAQDPRNVFEQEPVKVTEASLAHLVETGEAQILGIDPSNPNGGLIIARKVPEDDPKSLPYKGFDGDLIHDAACAAHEANRQYCENIGDDTQVAWEHAPVWQRTSAIMGVHGVIDGNGPRESHASWLAEKLRDGWRYGATKDPEAKTHPCMLGYDDLPMRQREKDHVFVSVVRRVLGMDPWPRTAEEAFVSPGDDDLEVLDADDGISVPAPEEVDAILRDGLCDSTALLGQPVLYETDRRGGKTYALPAVVTVIRSLHPDLGVLNGNTRAIQIAESYNGNPIESDGGYWIPGNPVPIPHTGSLHLKVTTPGPKHHYDEWSVRYDPNGGPRTWRFLQPNDANPF